MFRITFALLGVLLFILTAFCAPSHAAPATPDSEFRAKFEEFKSAIRDIEQQRNAYQAGDEAAQEGINQALGEQVEAAQKLLDEMVPLAEEAYAAAPNQDEEITKFLLSVAQTYAVGRSLDKEGTTRQGGDQYERALEIVNLLSEGDAEEPKLPVWGFVCAVVTNNFDEASKYLKQIATEKALVDPKEIKEPAEKQVMTMAWNYAAALDVSRQQWEQEQEIRKAEAEADDLPRVKLTTSKGDIVVELFENEAPIAVANFINLVKQGFYDGLAFHRVLSGFMAQGGCPIGNGTGGPGHMIRCESQQENARNHFRGSLSMAHAGRDTGGSQFFMTFVPTSHLDGAHTVFGRVVEGMDVLNKLQRRNPKDDPQQDQLLPEPDTIISAEVLRDRGHEYSFPKLPRR